MLQLNVTKKIPRKFLSLKKCNIWLSTKQVFSCCCCCWCCVVIVKKTIQIKYELYNWKRIFIPFLFPFQFTLNQWEIIRFLIIKCLLSFWNLIHSSKNFCIKYTWSISVAVVRSDELDFSGVVLPIRLHFFWHLVIHLFF